MSRNKFMRSLAIKKISSYLFIVLLIVCSLVNAHDTFVDVIPVVKPSVVTIEVRRNKSRSRSTQQREIKELLGEHADFFSEEVKDLPVSSSGSGFVVKNLNVDQQNLHVLTAAHVVDQATKITVSFFDGNSSDAEVIWVSRSSDVAMLRVKHPGYFDGLELSNSSLSEGQSVLAISGAFGFSLSSSVGVLSALDVTVGSRQKLIQTDAAINPGSSGAPLFNEDGKVIGLISTIYSTTGTFSGASFAVSAETLKRLIDQ